MICAVFCRFLAGRPEGVKLGFTRRVHTDGSGSTGTYVGCFGFLGYYSGLIGERESAR